ncbi:phosphatidylinositol-glycan biosynthesis class S protein-domain-containing protein [Lactifluus volemus]|nr:phosphatidylinositol-glycan biosynthesis class S protein-domain-containing protein [Lactifluus volemus]
MSDDEHNLKDPSLLTFEGPYIRRCILASYLVLVILSLPLWWSTTSIERLSLPKSHIDSLAAKELRLPIAVTVDTANVGSMSDNLVEQLRTMFKLRKEKVPALFNHLEFSVEPFQGSSSPDVYSISLNEDAQFPAIRKRHLSVPMHQANRAPDCGQICPRYRLAFTLLNEDAAAGRAVIGWDVAKMISRWITPILKETEKLHNFTVESQIQFYAPLAFEPLVVSNGERVIHGLTQENLKVFVNSAEWTLASSVSNDPVLHFVVFVPSISHTPLRILDDTSQVISSDAFVLPQWGGIVLLNLPADTQSNLHLTEAELDHVFSGFSAQLLRLIGVSELPAGVRSGDPSRPLTDFQLDTLYRQRAFENAGSSKETLQSIDKLVDQIPNMPVGQDVRDDVREALSALEVLYAGVWKAPALALQHSSRGLTLASRAFFNPGMLALLYFPAEHKYAVYTPLFAPVAVPLVVTLLKEVSAWRKARKRGNAP